MMNKSAQLNFILNIIIIFAIFAIIHGCVTKDKFAYCAKVYPVHPNCDQEGWQASCSYASFAPVEEGYIKCCRAVYEDHERVDQCEVFEYNG